MNQLVHKLIIFAFIFAFLSFLNVQPGKFFCKTLKCFKKYFTFLKLQTFEIINIKIFYISNILGSSQASNNSNNLRKRERICKKLKRQHGVFDLIERYTFKIVCKERLKNKKNRSKVL